MYLYTKKLLYFSVISLLLQMQGHAACLSQNKMLSLVQQGQIISINKIYPQIQSKGINKLISNRLCQNKNIYYYDVKAWDQEGNVINLRINAKSGNFL